jgi:5-oxoprolinase (ATP-hydrolysing)
VAERLGVETVLIPTSASLLSAQGLADAVFERFEERQVLRPLAEVESAVEGWMEELAARARAAVEAEGVPREEIRVRRRFALLRFVGQDSTLSVEPSGETPLRRLFENRYV